MSIDMEIAVDDLGTLPLYPPRRRLVDLIPTFLISWLRKRYSWPKATPRETWAVSGLMLRVVYQTQRTAALIEEVPKPFYLSENKDPIVTNSDDTDPWKFN